MMIIITGTFVITNEIHFWTLPVHTITTANTRGWSPLIFNMATILTKKVKDVHLLHSSGHTPARDTRFSSAICEEYWQGICLFWKLADWYPSPPNSSTKLDEFEKRLYIKLFSILFYPDWYPSLVGSGTNLPIFSRQSDTLPIFFTNSGEKAFNRAGVCPELCNRCTSLTCLVNIVAILKINGLHPRVFAVVIVWTGNVQKWISFVITNVTVIIIIITAWFNKR